MIRGYQMRELTKLLEGLEYEISGRKAQGIEIGELVFDSRKLSQNCLFVCITGANFDGHDFASEAARSKAAAIVIEKDVILPKDNDLCIIKVPDTRRALAVLSSAYFDHPSDRMKTIGVTGTKGKTTTTYLIKHMLENAGHRVGLVGTIETIIGSEHIPSKNTTPESYTLQKYFREMADLGLDTVVMEVSSQALMMHRTDGFVFDIGVFTNLSPDHIGPNEHRDFEDYQRCKGLLFRQCRAGIINGDDEHAGAVLEGHTCLVETFGLSKENDIRAENVELVNNGDSLGVSFDVKGLIEFRAVSAFPGRFSVYNALAAIAVCRHFDTGIEDMKKALQSAKVKGRIEMIPMPGKFILMIDYAHNAMALESLLSTLREYNPKRLVCVFGCGGNRSKLRRFEMGEVSGKLSDLTIITSDNPRFEEPQAIMEDIETGIKKTDGKYIMIIDRKEAIAYAINHAQDGDVIVLAGKGHEDYQEIRGNKYPMDERELIREILA
ncbi:MAG: UDP-N-acetylmuramoyl-L-alanyl-D-glutamate--2,6-diaminopimelate ligase [Lachnospiraceae bacterium]|nr:UDP-N-acetylmuramoyl-L-alanyl-D-glutamate--2,6-diaminopimelate ligase [Lachnospiraceae bacterium]